MQRRVAMVMSVVVLGSSACSVGGSASDDSTATSDGAVEVVSTDDAGAEPSASTNDEHPVGGSDADFCAAISAIQSADFELEETFGDEARQLFDDVQSAAPREISDDVGTVVATLEAIAELGVSTDEDDPAAIEAVSEILLDPDFTEASENLEAYTSVACDIDLGDGDDVEIDDLEGFDDLDGSGDTEEPIGSDGLDDSGEPFDPTVISIEGLQMFFAADPSTADLLDEVYIYKVDEERDIDLRGSGIEGAAEQICLTALDYALALEPDATVRVADVAEVETSEVIAELVGDGSSDGCARA